MTYEPKLPPLADLLELIDRGDSHATIGAQYGVSRDAVSAAIKRARKRGDIPPAPARVVRESTPTRRATARPTDSGSILGELSITVQSGLSRAARKAQQDRALPPPADGPRCGARQALGTRVCDQAPHGPGTACVGEGARDARGEFWGRLP